MKKFLALFFLILLSFSQKKNLILLILIFSLVLPVSLDAKKIPKMPKKYKKWLKEEVVYIITPKEEKAFKQLETDKQRDLFVEELWRQRDPTPGIPRNEFRDEHYRRIDYANKWFGKGTAKPGWKTERGRIYIILGEPIYRVSHEGASIEVLNSIGECYFQLGNQKKAL